ncbi:GIY-YIG nuclease family protein [Vibrio superstes]|uniref:GIY-YIG domain-containing protein n=1 Tax=Vibrio superstes NBRC 103154 TaxID=1219062 RepID=A0A511QKL5_9VIBR|nr:GIY-YIG nuclease family protein [Vibrio superstes]GEM77868.1 hypothetical protein VSU01S_01130 [Vibrio superstes NBRC 103154]
MSSKSNEYLCSEIQYEPTHASLTADDYDAEDVEVISGVALERTALVSIEPEAVEPELVEVEDVNEAAWLRLKKKRMPTPLKPRKDKERAIDSTQGFCGIYRIYQIKSGESYIGQAKNIGRRWRKHFYDLSHQKHHNDKLQRAWRIHKPKLFQFEVLELCQPHELDALEEKYIGKFDSCESGFNKTENGQGLEGEKLEWFLEKKRKDQALAEKMQARERENQRKRVIIAAWYDGYAQLLNDVKKEVSAKYAYGEKRIKYERGLWDNTPFSVSLSNLAYGKENEHKVLYELLRTVFDDAVNRAVMEVASTYFSSENMDVPSKVSSDHALDYRPSDKRQAEAMRKRAVVARQIWIEREPTHVEVAMRHAESVVGISGKDLINEVRQLKSNLFLKSLASLFVKPNPRNERVAELEEVFKLETSNHLRLQYKEHCMKYGFEPNMDLIDKDISEWCSRW